MPTPPPANISGTLPDYRDGNLARKLLKQAKNGDKLTAYQLKHLHAIVETSNNNNTLTRKDRKAVTHLLANLVTQPYGHKKEYNQALAGLTHYMAHGTPQAAKVKKSDAMKNNPFYQLIHDNQRPANHQVMGTAKQTSGPGTKKRAHAQIVKRAAAKAHGNGQSGNGTPIQSLPYTQPGMTYYGMGTPPTVDNKYVRTAVGQDINSQVRALVDQLQASRSDNQYNLGQLGDLYNRTKGDLNYVYGESQDSINGQQKIINNRFAATQKALNTAYSNSAAQQAKATATNQQNAMNELNRLGIQQTGLGQFSADAANNAAVASQVNANNNANLAAMQQNANTIGSMLNSMSNASLNSALSRAAIQNQDQVAAQQHAFSTNKNSILDQITGVKRQRGSMINDLSTQLQQNAYQQWMDQQQQDFNNTLASSQFNLDVSKLNSSNLWQKAKLRQQANQAAAQRRQQQQYMNMLATGKKNNTALLKLLAP